MFVNIIKFISSNVTNITISAFGGFIVWIFTNFCQYEILHEAQARSFWPAALWQFWAYLSCRLVLSPPEIIHKAQHLSHHCKHLGSSHFVIVSLSTCVSVWIPTLSPNLCPFNQIVIFWKRKSLERKYLSLLAWSCRSLHTESWFCLWVSFIRGAQILQQSVKNFI